MATGQSANKLTVSGYLKDEEGNAIINAHIYAHDQQTGFHTDEEGFYKILLKQGPDTLTFSSIGYHSLTVPINIFNDDTILNFTLKNKTALLEEVLIEDHALKPLKRQGSIQFTSADIEKVPMIFGEPDAIKMLQLQPGIKFLGDGSSAIYSRGGARDQNLVLFDGAPIYNINHMYGFITAISPAISGTTSFYNGYIPVNYGGRASSIVSITSKDLLQSPTGLSVSGGIASLSTSLGAVYKTEEKAGYMINARKSLFDLFTNASPDMGLLPSFHDIYGKSQFQLKKGTLSVGVFHSFDRQEEFENFRNDWTNNIVNLSLETTLGNYTSQNTSLSYSGYSNSFVFPDDSVPSFSSGLRTFRLQSTFATSFANHRISYGYEVLNHHLSPDRTLSDRNLMEMAVYASHEMSFSGFILDYGIRLSSFMGYGNISYYGVEENRPTALVEEEGLWYREVNPEPRIKISYGISDKHQVSFTYNNARQYLHTITNASLGYNSPEVMLNSGQGLESLNAHLFVFGYEYEHRPGDMLISLEAYYKKVHNQPDIINNAFLTSNPFVLADLRTGYATSYGLETFIWKGFDRLSFSGSYTFSSTLFHIEDITQDGVYNAPFDIPHDIKVTGNYQISERLSLSLNWVFMSGRPVTVSSQKFVIDPNMGRHPVSLLNAYGERNSGRLPSYHRADLMVMYKLKSKGSYIHHITLGAYNAYARRNIIDLRFNALFGGQIEAVHFYTIIPTISYQFNFTL